MLISRKDSWTYQVRACVLSLNKFVSYKNSTKIQDKIIRILEEISSKKGEVDSYLLMKLFSLLFIYKDFYFQQKSGKCKIKARGKSLLQKFRGWRGGESGFLKKM